VSGAEAGKGVSAEFAHIGLIGQIGLCDATSRRLPRRSVDKKPGNLPEKARGKKLCQNGK
jgi:hypothetical protein